MNKIKRLFSPSALAATVATGLLASSVALAVADECTSTSAFAWWQTFPGCGQTETLCQGLDGHSELTYYCCPNNKPICGGVTGPDWNGNRYGWCCPHPDS